MSNRFTRKESEAYKAYENFMNILKTRPGGTRTLSNSKLLTKLRNALKKQTNENTRKAEILLKGGLRNRELGKKKY